MNCTHSGPVGGKGLGAGKGEKAHNKHRTKGRPGNPLTLDLVNARLWGKFWGGWSREDGKG